MKIIYFILFSMLASYLQGQTAGTLTFTVTTINYSAPYSPTHILAIWISNENVQWIKTRKFMAQNPIYKQYLTNFRNTTSGTYNAIDAITGPTIPNHISHTVYWDGKDVNGNLVSDGNYRVYIEFTSANATGKLHFLQFVKGPLEQTLNPASQPNFTNMSLKWSPQGVGIEDEKTIYPLLACFPNPFSDYIYVAFKTPNHLPARVIVYDNSGRQVRNLCFEAIPDKNQIIWDGKNQDGNPVSRGIYYISAEQGENKQMRKVIKQ
ncbi:MAG: DUF2271 domain-containing protein [Bacteroidales bacterium]|nr:DUF2271 domain-containing protein [Bacteroidales bacterium]MDZ4204219.1 DUF2271 domain-containing protein [Bacteroidales bacterium]